MEQNWQSGNPLPMAKQAEIDPRKFTEYSMNPFNTNNQGKWQAFMILGYNIESSQGRQIAAQSIINQIRLHLENNPATLDEPSEYGIRFTVTIPIIGINYLQGTLVTKWQIDKNKQIPRLITNWLKINQNNG
ncbi:MAG: hypothetical protein IM486_00250 [Microcystis sp. M114S2]|jgi:hypothetical protein|uniref:DUF6883 domain-containing protein n=4 Tax=Microcystis TaxID=1125 RepID=I4HG90_MICAE|nr:MULTISPECIES: DUF6883 domain-containing protein [Microcystis]MCA2715301.1 hypothetical protein [Microcystis sp. M172S2]NCR02179.1 hypothetical protein [Microcystis aeruginosa L211-11]NCR33767.1 hypothetical protein [Microcystis aeruginosa L211-101]KAB0242575.1 hypothetical protein EZJ55_20505 [Microcystis aeruginosa EAWAG127a]MCA2665777.1 hypothetical protein [Microcystis sp. M045S2]